MKHRVIRWVLPLVVFLMLVLAFVLIPVVQSRAAGETTATPTPTTTQQVSPNLYWHD